MREMDGKKEEGNSTISTFNPSNSGAEPKSSGSTKAIRVRETGSSGDLVYVSFYPSTTPSNQYRLFLIWQNTNNINNSIQILI